MLPPRFRSAAVLLVLWACAAPTSPPAAQPAPAPPAPSTPVEPEANVRPDANAEFLKTDLNVDAWTQRFERGGRDIFDNRERLLSISGAGPGTRVGDIGAGTGLFTMLFSDRVGPTGKVYAVDIAPRFLEHIDRRVTEARVTNVVTVRASDRSSELPAASIDLAFICDVYHHFEYPKSTLASLFSALRPGGTLMLVDFRRVPGKSAPWVAGHVRAGEEVFTAEIEAAGFRKVSQHDVLKENYVLLFRRP